MVLHHQIGRQDLREKYVHIDDHALLTGFEQEEDVGSCCFEPVVGDWTLDRLVEQQGFLVLPSHLDVVEDLPVKEYVIV